MKKLVKVVLSVATLLGLSVGTTFAKDGVGMYAKAEAEDILRLLAERM